MKQIKKNSEQTISLLTKIRGAAHSPYEFHKIQRFKYKVLHLVVAKLKNIIKLARLSKNKLTKEVSNLYQTIDIKKMIKDSSVWILEALIEGATASYVTHKLLGLEFGVGMILAHGFLIKQGIDIFWRLRKNGSTK